MGLGGGGWRKASEECNNVADFENEIKQIITALKVSNFNNKIWSDFSSSDTELVGPSFNGQSITSFFSFIVCQ